MKVKVAAQTLSRTVSVYLYNLVQQNILSPRSLATATFIQEMDELFDSLNASARVAPDGKPFKCIVSEESGHTSFWEDAFRRVNQYKFIRKPDDEFNAHHWKPPSQRGWLHTLRATTELWKFLKTQGVKTLKTKCINQDGLENLFGNIRAGCGSNENPTVTQFIGSLKTQIINGLTNQGLKGTNCEEDELTLLSNLRSLLEPAAGVSESVESMNESSIEIAGTSLSNYSNSSAFAVDIANAVEIGSLQTLSVAYVSGFITKKLFSNFVCDRCSYILSSDDTEPCNQFISNKEFSNSKNKLFYPSKQFVIAVGIGITVLENKLPIICEKNNLQGVATNLLNQEIDFSFITCEEHFYFLKDFFLKSICRIGIPWYCTRLVRNLRSEASRQMSARTKRKILHK
ncbi:uncharacterized protein LOC130447009 [Diorhabda sublineata]|uniref:uncharacterized protein LOC130447009 n=1 Tax=Diorhabda sublineata TaxID=1163346 RepID=UPI0024E0DE07|nr:uncharacterized protein LOC130447009 [Diorhabda sublineata]XP_056639579.1 uncharacterized protein LOC130447009 [Diorhabda sublineata]